MKRPKLTMCRMLVVVLLIAAYFGAWEATKREAARREIETHSVWTVWNGTYSSPAPFLVKKHFVVSPWDPRKDEYHCYKYKLWFFGLFED